MNKTITKTLSGIYAITDAKLMGADLITKAEDAINGGIRVLQYRNKNAPAAQQFTEASTLATLCRNKNVTFIINDNVELAKSVNADGVHLGQQDTHLSKARQQLGNNKIIGVTCNNQLEYALTAQSGGADYVAFGRFFNSQTKPGAPHADISLLTHARSAISIPVVAIGGITYETAPLLLQQGADMLAIIHGIFAQQDIINATRQFVKIYETSRTPEVSV
ncbi:MAG: thiamine phosphate synthase [Gammaproteobacteria bacterium]|nr:thiamine phosphate synthase [Gammaproteobacteria bacterium]